MSERVNASELPHFAAAFAQARRFGALLTRHDLDWPVRWAKRVGAPKLFGRREASPPLPDPTRQMLEDFYRAEVAALEHLLGHDLEVWRSGARAPAARRSA
jgi:hypothetical protein